MTHNIEQQIQEQNTAKLVMNAFNKLENEEGTTAQDIARYLQDKFGDVWRLNVLTSKAEDTLKRSAALGFLARHGDRYIATMAKQLRCGRKRRRRRRSCRPRRSRRRRRRSCRPRRRRRIRRRRSCGCS